MPGKNTIETAELGSSERLGAGVGDIAVGANPLQMYHAAPYKFSAEHVAHLDVSTDFCKHNLILHGHDGGGIVAAKNGRPGLAHTKARREAPRKTKTPDERKDHLAKAGRATWGPEGENPPGSHPAPPTLEHQGRKLGSER